MITCPAARQLALSLPEAEQKSHFEKPDFRVRNRIFAVLHIHNSTMVVKLSLVDQSVFCKVDPALIYRVAGGWGRKGWTVINLKKIKKPLFVEILKAAWKNTAPASLFKRSFPAG